MRGEIFQLLSSHTAHASAYCTHVECPSPELIPHSASSQPHPFSILSHSPAHFSTRPKSCNLFRGHRLKGQAAAGREGDRERKG